MRRLKPHKPSRGAFAKCLSPASQRPVLLGMSSSCVAETFLCVHPIWMWLIAKIAARPANQAARHNSKTPSVDRYEWSSKEKLVNYITFSPRQNYRINTTKLLYLFNTWSFFFPLHLTCSCWVVVRAHSVRSKLSSVMMEMFYFWITAGISLWESPSLEAAVLPAGRDSLWPTMTCKFWRDNSRN